MLVWIINASRFGVSLNLRIVFMFLIWFFKMQLHFFCLQIRVQNTILWGNYFYSPLITWLGTWTNISLNVIKRTRRSTYMHTYLVIGSLVASSILRSPKKHSKISYQNIKDIQCSSHGLESHSCTHLSTII